MKEAAIFFGTQTLIAGFVSLGLHAAAVQEWAIPIAVAGVLDLMFVAGIAMFGIAHLYVLGHERDDD